MEFAEIPFVRAQTPSTRGLKRIGAWAFAGMLAFTAVASALAYRANEQRLSEERAPRAVVEVSGMHCPVQCGMKVAAALETLPGVIPGTVTANPKTGIVTFGVSQTDRLTREDIERVIAEAGFAVKSVRLPPTQ